MNRHVRRVIALVLVGILVAVGLVGGGWWLGQQGERQPAAAGITTAPPSGSPTTPTAPGRLPHRPHGSSRNADDPCAGGDLAAAAGRPIPAVLLA